MLNNKLPSLLTLLILLATAAGTVGGDSIIRVGYLSQQVELPPALSNLDETPIDEGLAGARLAIDDNNTTGKFTGQTFELVSHRLQAGGDPATAFANLVANGIHFVVLDLHGEALERVMDAVGDQMVLLFNAGARDRRFREAQCHPRLLHTALSRDMETDALAQYFVKKRWNRWLLITGPRNEDRLFADAIRRSARKFGLKVVKERNWTGEHDARRTAQAEVPLFTQGVDYDVLMVADEIGDFGDYLLYRTWKPGLVAGTQALVARGWGRPVEQWGAAQLQERFAAQLKRWMTSRDYASWLAVRSVGEEALRTQSGEFADIDSYIRSGQFQLAAFKGRKLNYRHWNGQLRQPVPIMTARSLVAQAPVEGFLHQHTDLDTLGIDRPESRCSMEGG